MSNGPLPASIPGLFVVGTDTGVGKTRVAAALARTWVGRGHRVGVVKPVSTGATRGEHGFVAPDVVQLAESITTEGSPFPPPPLDRVGPLVFEAPLAPPVAARLAGTPLEPATLVRALDEALLWWRDVAGVDRMVVEGVGGLLCPVAEGGYTVADLAQHLDYPLLIVAHRGLGTLNHTLLTVEAAQARGLRVAGVVLNAARASEPPSPSPDPAEASNAEELARLLPGTAILADWPHDDAAYPPVPVAPEAGDWLDLALPPRGLVGVPGKPEPAGPAGPVAPATASTDLLVVGSVLDDPAASDDELANPARDLLDSSSESLASLTPATPPLPMPVSVDPAPAPPWAPAWAPTLADPPAQASPSNEFSALNLNLGQPSEPARASAPLLSGLASSVFPPAAAPASPPTVAPGPVANQTDADDDDDEPPSTWRSALLTSYASAITLALGWTLYQHRNDQTRESPPEVAAPDPAHGAGRLGDRSRTIDPLPPVAADRTVPLGQTLTVGSLAIEPVEVSRQDVTLERVGLTGRPETKAGGRRVVALRVRLRNTSADAVFAPVDPAFVRPDTQDQSETLLELKDGRKVYTYPLAVDSEWSISGQGFGDLRPGESREVVLATTPDAPPGAERAPGVWRIKLRTGGAETAVVGVRLNAPSGPG